MSGAENADHPDTNHQGIKRLNIVVASVLLAVGLLMAYESTQMSLYTSIGPGPGFFPIWISLGIIGTSIHWLWGATRPPYRSVHGLEPADKSGAYRIAVAATSSLGFAVLLNPLGFIPACFLYLLVLLKIISRSSLGGAIVVAALTSLGVALLFSFLGVRLPPSFLDNVF